jgi:hypothetical protein
MTYLIPRYTEQIRRGMDLCLGEALVIPALALPYSGIDVLGFLAPTEPRATRQTFIRWADAYLAAFLNRKGIGGIDLYSARCGVLHTGQAPSDLVDLGEARGRAVHRGRWDEQVSEIMRKRRQRVSFAQVYCSGRVIDVQQGVFLGSGDRSHVRRLNCRRQCCRRDHRSELVGAGIPVHGQGSASSRYCTGR